MAIPFVPVATQPTAVTVFSDRARITRLGRTMLEAGLRHLTIDNLPLALQPESVRASGRGTARAKLLGVTTHLEHFSETPAQAARDLEQRIQSAEDTDAGLLAQSSVVEKEQRYLDGLAAQSEMWARGLALRNRLPQEQAEIFEYVSSRSRALQAEQLELGRQRRELAKTLDQMRRELKDLTSARPRKRYLAVIELEVSAPGDFELELTYVVTGAGWQPLYDLRLTDVDLEISYLAQVMQDTGEDWPGVTLTLSTARPSLSLALPELEPWYIRPRPPVVQPPARAKSSRPPVAPVPAARMAADEAPNWAASAARPEALEAFEAEVATVSEAGASLTYRLAGSAQVPGNHEPRKVTVATVRLKPDLTYVTAPKLESVCYRRAEVKNDSAYSLLPGGAQLFEGDEYLGATRLEFVAPGQTFELALGADERLRVERELLARDVDKAFILGDRRRIRYGFGITLENLRDAAQLVVVRDQIPVPRDEQIKVRIESADPKPAEQSELGLLEWKLTLDKGTKRTIRFDFSVEHPRAMDVIGLL
ncbi:MAG: mucoidy inhibitor MuiA family protein [Anaerolineales bacterium]|nr:mucoidy inhibitor MuiA family protein [Anaerolineales bacterium]